MAGIYRGYKFFWCFVAILLGAFMLFVAISRFISLAPDMRLVVADQLVYFLVGIGFIVLGILMFRAVKKGKL